MSRIHTGLCGGRITALPQLPKLETRVRLPSAAGFRSPNGARHHAPNSVCRAHAVFSGASVHATRRIKKQVTMTRPLNELRNILALRVQKLSQISTHVLKDNGTQSDVDHTGSKENSSPNSSADNAASQSDESEAAEKPLPNPRKPSSLSTDDPKAVA